MRKLKICLLIDKAYPQKGGPSSYYREFGKVLKTMGHKVYVINYERVNKNLFLNNFMYHLYTIKSAVYLILGNYDITIASFSVMQNFSRYVLRFFQRKPYILVILGSDWIDIYRPIFIKGNFIERLAVKYIDWSWKIMLQGASIVVSFPDMLEKIKKYNVNERKQHILPMLIDFSIFNPITKPVKLPCQQEDIFKLLFVGRLVEIKGVEYLIRSIPFVLRHSKKIHLYIVGAGRLEENLKYLSSKIGVKSFITFSGEVSHSLIPSYMAAADLIVYPISLGAGVGLVTLEAMAMKKPLIIGEANSTIKELFERYQCGEIVQPKNSEDLAEKIIYLLENPNRRVEIAENAYKYTLKELNAFNVYNTVMNILLKVQALL